MITHHFAAMCSVYGCCNVIRLAIRVDQETTREQLKERAVQVVRDHQWQVDIFGFLCTTHQTQAVRANHA